jgi:hypothetical protein
MENKTSSQQLGNDTGYYSCLCCLIPPIIDDIGSGQDLRNKDVDLVGKFD